MSWFKRAKEGLRPQAKKEMPDLWVKCPSCAEIIYKPELERNFHVCIKCKYHFRIRGQEYLRLLLDDGRLEEMDADMQSVDFLKFKAQKRYAEQLKAATKKTGLKEAVRTGLGKINGHEVIICVMDFSFIGGSMGSVVGEKIARAARRALERRLPLIVISASGGARMMEGAMSLMQMAKTSAELSRLHDAGVLFISILTDPTTGGVTASYAMLGDINLAEPGALIGFAGPRVIKQTIGQDLPAGFQRAEFLLEHGFVDSIVERHELKQKLTQILEFFQEDHAGGPTNDGFIDQAEAEKLITREAQTAPPASDGESG